MDGNAFFYAVFFSALPENMKYLIITKVLLFL